MNRETAAFVCSHVFRNTHPVLLVARETGDWMFLCGQVHSNDESYHVIGREHLLERDPSLTDIWDLPEQFEAERQTVGGAWVRQVIKAE